MKYFYSLIIVLIIFSVGIEAYYCVMGRVPYYLPEGSVPRLILYFSFFTVLSSIALGIGCLLVIIHPHYESNGLAILRVDGIVGVIITGIVYNVMLRSLHHPDIGILKLTNECLHVVIPLLGVIGWLLFDPHNKITKRCLFYAFIPPILYLVYIFVRGLITGLYPYPILDISRVGVLTVSINVVVITVIFIVFAILLYFADNYWLTKR